MIDAFLFVAICIGVGAIAAHFIDATDEPWGDE